MPDMTVQRRQRHCELEPLPYHWDAPPFGRIQERIGEDLRGCLEVPTDLPHQLLTLLMQLGRDGEGGRSAAERPRLRRKATRAFENEQCSRRRTAGPRSHRSIEKCSSQAGPSSRTGPTSARAAWPPRRGTASSRRPSRNPVPRARDPRGGATKAEGPLSLGNQVVELHLRARAL